MLQPNIYIEHTSLTFQKLNVTLHVINSHNCLALITHSDYGVIESFDEIDAVGHRVVHGGEKISGSVVINDEVIKAMRNA